MSKLLVLLSLMFVHLSISSAYNINIAIKVEDDTQMFTASTNETSPLVLSPDGNSLVESLVEDLEESYQDLTKCGFSKIVKCTAKITAAIMKCKKSPDIVKCIEGILGANSKCKDCIKKICKKLHIKACR
eukprot:GFUD01014581.1.p1 GENE.GFUD01014581.1~~GFUD01014581.1.p1  ORF type:complete len:130 (+),score=37.78 GFUD01014581.1:95-484(+)